MSYFLSIVIPIYNEEAVLEPLLKRLDQLIQKIPEKTEIIFVDDGSQDKSFEILEQICAENTHKKLIKFSRNFGHQYAVTAGLKAATGKGVVVIDADLQDPPETILDLIKVWQSGFDVVHAVRKDRAGETRFKLITAHFFYKILDQITETPIVRNCGDFRLMDQKVVQVLNSLPERHRFLRGLSSWVGFRQSCVFYERHARAAGHTKYTFKKMMNLATNAITSLSDMPLKISFFLGLFVSIFSFLSLFIILILKVWGIYFVKGWVSLLLAISFSNGILMIMVGFLSIYVGRIFEEIKGRPLYIIEKTKGIK